MRPFRYISNNECPKCFHKLILVERELSYTTLSNNGLPLNTSIVSDYDARLICEHCKTVYHIEKVGAIFRIAPTTPTIKKKNNIVYNNPFLEK